MRRFSGQDKFIAEYQAFNQEENEVSDIKQPFKFSYFDGKGTTREISEYMRGWSLNNSSGSVIATNSEIDFSTKDNIFINGSKSKITSVFTERKANLGGNRFTTRSDERKILFIG